MATSSDARSTGSGFRNSVLTSVKIAVFTPIPSASDATAAAVKAGDRRNVRSAKRTSFQSCSMPSHGSAPARKFEVQSAKFEVSLYAMAERLSMIRSYTWADLLTLGNATCGTVTIFACLSYIAGEQTQWLWAAFVLPVLAL